VAVWIRRADWPLDDGGIVYHERHDTTGYDIFRFDFRSNAARRLAATKYEEAQGQIDRDGRCAYISDEAGRMNVYVRLSIDDSRAERISPDGGWDPRWREDGGELFYVSDSHLMSVEMPRGQIRPAASPGCSRCRRAGLARHSRATTYRPGTAGSSSSECRWNFRRRGRSWSHSTGCAGLSRIGEPHVSTPADTVYPKC
jgi:hypothetical protein